MSKTLGTQSNLPIPIHSSPFHHKTALRLTMHNGIIKTNHTNRTGLPLYPTLNHSIYPQPFCFSEDKTVLRWHSVGIALALIDEQMKGIKTVESLAIVGFPAFSPYR